jgi:hypothetical protein
VAATECSQVFKQFWVEDGRADPVDPGSPLAEVDFAAAVTAEGEVLAIECDKHGAGGAAEEFGGFFLGRHGDIVSARRLISIFSPKLRSGFSHPLSIEDKPVGGI